MISKKSKKSKKLYNNISSLFAKLMKEYNKDILNGGFSFGINEFIELDSLKISEIEELRQFIKTLDCQKHPEVLKFSKGMIDGMLKELSSSLDYMSERLAEESNQESLENNIKSKLSKEELNYIGWHCR